VAAALEQGEAQGEREREIEGRAIAQLLLKIRMITSPLHL
jgi:hypothetical protein